MKPLLCSWSHSYDHAAYNDIINIKNVHELNWVVKGKRKRTGWLGSKETCLRLNLVPLVLAIHTSNPLSAKINGRSCSGGFRSHVIPSCTDTRQIKTTQLYAATYAPRSYIVKIHEYKQNFSHIMSQFMWEYCLLWLKQ